MQVFKYLTLAFVGSVVASPVLSTRDAATVTNDISSLQTKTIALNSSVTAFDGDLFKALAVYIAAQDVQTALNQTVQDARASPAFDDNGSASVGIAILNFQPIIFSTLDNLVSKKPLFDKLYIVSPIVKASLTTQRGLAQDLGNAIVPKLTPSFAALAPPVVKAIDDKFAQAIQAYSTFSLPSKSKTH